MEFSHANGVICALIISALQIASLIRATFLPSSSNLKKLGMRWSWIDGLPKTGQPLPILVRLLGLVALHLLAILLSWLTVVIAIVQTCNRLYTALLMPNTIKESAWRFKYHNLSFDETVLHWGVINGIDEQGLNQFKSLVRDEIENQKDLNKTG
jgi:hypothetical protein